MVSLAAAALAVATLCWPLGSGRGRLTRMAHNTARAASHVAKRRWKQGQAVAAMIALAAGLGAMLAGPGGACAAATATGTVGLRWAGGRDRRADAAATSGLSDALGILVGELRAGAHPADAVAAAAVDAHPEVRRALSAAASAARLGGAVPGALRDTDSARLGPWLRRIADAWALAHRHGVALADLLDTVRADTEARVRFAADLQARLAGPRTTASVLAGLPVLGLVLGQAVGADPVRVLADTAVGQVLLVVGTGLACAGVLWSARLTAGVVRV